MSKITEMNIPVSKESAKSATSHDFGNNIGELFKKEKVESKSGQKVTKQKAAIEEAKIILKTLDMSEDIESTKTKAKEIIKILYSSRGLQDQFSYLDKKRSTQEIVTQCYNIVTSKMEWYEKNLSEFESEIDGE